LKNKDKLSIYIDSTSIRKRVVQLAKRLNKDYKNKVPVFIGILNGSFVFLSDLVRQLKIELEIDFLKLSSYGDDKISSGDIRLVKGLNSSVENRDVVIVEDIIDSGSSVKFINELISHHKPNSLEFVALLYKKNMNKLDFNIKYAGFKIPDKFVVGYGLDYAQKYRNLKSIYIINN